MPIHEQAIFVDYTCMALAVPQALPTSHIQHLLGGSVCGSAGTALRALCLRGWNSNLLEHLARVTPGLVQRRLAGHSACLSWPAVFEMSNHFTTLGQYNGSILPAAIMLGALSVPIVVILSAIAQ